MPLKWLATLYSMASLIKVDKIRKVDLIYGMGQNSLDIRCLICFLLVSGDFYATQCMSTEKGFHYCDKVAVL